MAESRSSSKVPRRSYGGRLESPNLPNSLPIVGLGCSSFSTFFWKDDSKQLPPLTNPPNPDHPIVLEWIETIRYAVLECGINLIDTAPWYGHGMSEYVIGYAMEGLLAVSSSSGGTSSPVTMIPKVRRKDIFINTKVGRYEKDESNQFDFSAKRVKHSTLLSIERMKCGYIDVLQLHDPEFSPSIDYLLEETIPAMAKLRDEEELVKAIGMTGYPLSVQRELIERSYHEHGILFDQALVYCHYNLHDQSLFTKSLPSTFPGGESCSFIDFCQSLNVGVIAAAPLSMGLLTHAGPREWHPASADLKGVCQDVAKMCKKEGIDISVLAMLFALGNNKIPCTILGLKNKNEVDKAVTTAKRFALEGDLDKVLRAEERELLCVLLDRDSGPFSRIISTGNNEWDGIKEAEKFWSRFPGGKVAGEKILRAS